MDPKANLIEQDDVLAAREVIAGRVHRTPVMGSSYLGGQAGSGYFSSWSFSRRRAHSSLAAS